VLLLGGRQSQSDWLSCLAEGYFRAGASWQSNLEVALDWLAPFLFASTPSKTLLFILQ